LIVSMARFVIISLFITLLWSPLAAARTIAVVYDDSASMRQKNKTSTVDDYAYASYSLQLLRSLMKDNDKLLVVTMSNPGNVIFTSGGKATDDVRKLFELSKNVRAGQTPYTTIRTAIKALEKVNDSDRWLVVITDGEFNGNVPLLGKDDLDETAIANDLKKIPGLKTVLLGIATTADGVGIKDNPFFNIWAAQDGAQVLSASSAAEITTKMQEIAAMVTAGANGSGIRFSEVKGDTARFVSVFPLKRFTILQQTLKNSELAAVTGVSVGGKQLAYTRDVLEARTADKNLLQGRVVQVQSGKAGELIPAGTPIEVHFDKPITQANFSILPEVAVNLEVSIFDDSGKELRPDARKQISACVGSSAQVVARLVLPQGVATPPGMKDVKTSFSYAGSNTQLPFNPSSNTYVGAITIVKGDNPISTKAEYVGYINILDSGFILGQDDCKPRAFTLVAEQAGTRIKSWSTDVRDLCEAKAAPLELFIEADGKRLSPQEVKSWQATIDPASGIKMRITPTKNGQGWQLLPQTSFVGPCFTPTGTYPLQATINGKSAPVATAKEKPVLLSLTGKGIGPQDTIASASISLDIKNPGWMTRCKWLILGIILFLVFLWWLIGVYKKPRFAKGSSIEFERTGPGAKRDYEHLPGSFFGRYLIPYLPEKKIADGITFIASGSPSDILVSHKSIRQLGEGLTFNGRVKQPPVERDEKINTITRIEFRAGDSKTVYKYVRPPRSGSRKTHS